MASNGAGKSSAGQKPLVRIEYCTSWGYLSRAAGLAENLLHDYDEQLRGVTIAPGETGSFEVFLNRRKVFSKKALDRFPEVNEIEEKISELVGA
jgi:selenoprotein W-related protein